jgi:HPt (histidine-containing phosphotransfer) domain-containing protein
MFEVGACCAGGPIRSRKDIIRNTNTHNSAEGLRLLQLIDSDRALLAELVGVFREDYSRMIQDTQGAIRRSDAAGVQRGGHTLKGALGILAASEASNLAREIEAMGRTGNLALAGAKLIETQDEVHRALKTLDALILSVW